MKEIPYFPGYFITEEGRVWSLVKSARKGRWLSQHPGKRGHMRVWVQHPVLGALHMYVHRLVALAYIQNPGGLPEINHKDGVNTNNHYLNLEWATNKSNNAHKAEMGLAPHSENNWKAKLKNKDISVIRQLVSDGVPQTEVAVRFNVHPATINGIWAGRTWRHVQ